MTDLRHVEPITAKKFVELWGNGYTVVLYPQDYPVVFRALRVLEALEKEREVQQAQLTDALDAVDFFAEQAQWGQLAYRYELAQERKQTIALLDEILEEGAVDEGQ